MLGSFKIFVYNLNKIFILLAIFFYTFTYIRKLEENNFSKILNEVSFRKII